MNENASNELQLEAVQDAIQEGNNNTSGISGQIYDTNSLIGEVEQKQDQNFDQLKEIAKQLGLTEEGEEAKVPFYEIITDIQTQNDNQTTAIEQNNLAINETNSQLQSLNENLSREIQATSYDYSEQFTDLGTLLSYTNVLLLVLIVFVLFGVGIRAGGMVTKWLKTR